MVAVVRDLPVREAARALSAFDPMAALERVALRDDPPALALRGIAMAQLGEYPVARKLLRRAARAFGKDRPLSRARCVAAEAEIALVCRDLEAAGRGLTDAADVLEAQGDRANALFVRLQLVRRLVLLGRIDGARDALAALSLDDAPPVLTALGHLVAVDVALRGLRPASARRALARARQAATRARVTALTAEVDRAARQLEQPVARLHRPDGPVPVGLDGVKSLVSSGDLLVDACRREVRCGPDVRSLVTRPVLFALAAALAESAPGEAPRDQLVARAFGARKANDSLRARLRVELGRLRRVLEGLVEVGAAATGFRLVPAGTRRVVLLLPPAPGEASALVALLEAGEAWSTSALAAAVGLSQRSVQRALTALLDQGRVQSVGDGRSRRWTAPQASGFATTLLLARTRGLG
ncbi:MAG TPA: helix-turn-helix domain-containing protein [Polyangiaceae bacterium]|jgi:DNA-binding transcriptional ArsR family regulator|nr:helix-turn-helix domain-containing protein [Polyangiaceae bacterium]